MKIKVHLIVSLVILGLIVFGGAEFYQRVEGMDRVDSYYFVVMTMTTVGYGDFVPLTQEGKVFTIFFSFIGIATAFYFVSSIGTSIFNKYLNREIKRVRYYLEKEKQEEIEKEKEKIKKEKSKKRKKR